MCRRQYPRVHEHSTLEKLGRLAADAKLATGIARIEPFLHVLECLVVAGPRGFVAHLVFDLVEVSPGPGHLSFIAALGDAWLTGHPDNTISWEDSEIGQRLCVVIESIEDGSPTPFEILRCGIGWATSFPLSLDWKSR